MLQGGDIIAHGLPLDTKLVNTIQNYALQRIKTYFPDSAVLFVIGNNDLLVVKKPIIHVTLKMADVTTAKKKFKLFFFLLFLLLLGWCFINWRLFSVVGSDDRVIKFSCQASS